MSLVSPCLRTFLSDIQGLHTLKQNVAAAAVTTTVIFHNNSIGANYYYLEDRFSTMSRYFSR